jgi:hypothetical protein
MILQSAFASASVAALLAGGLACKAGGSPNRGFGSGGAGGESGPVFAAPDANPGAPRGSAGGDSLVAERPSAGESCAGSVFQPETIVYAPNVTLYIVLDNSESMEENGKWEQAKAAITEFVQAPTSAGIRIGIQYFHPQNVQPPPGFNDGVDPDDAEDYEPDKCDGIAHAQSAVEVGLLPEAAPLIVGSLAGTGPAHNTPTVGALTGGVNFCKASRAQRPDEECVVVLVTDGQPNSCGLSLACTPGFTPNAKGECVDPMAEAVLAPIARDAHDNFGIRTFTVGMEGVIDDGFDLLDKLAVAGGTDCTPAVAGEEACNVTETGGAGLLDALNLIRETVVVELTVPCIWALPPAPDGESLDPQLVNVSLTVSRQEVPLAQVATEAQCSAAGGWYYDQPSAPKEIRTCPQTCEVVSENPDDVRVELEFGCATRLFVR